MWYNVHDCNIFVHPNHYIKGNIYAKQQKREKQHGIVIIEINPLAYYKNVVLENIVLDIETDDNTVNTEEKENLEKNYVLRPGQVFEFNVNIDLGAITGATNHSVYSMVKMKVEKYVG